MESESISDNLHRLNEDIKDFARSTAEYYKLDLFNKSMKGATSAVKGLLIGFFLMFAVNFLSFGLAVLLSEAIGVPSSGFFIVGGIYILLICLVIFVFGKYIDKVILMKASRKFFNKPQEETHKFPEDERI